MLEGVVDVSCVSVRFSVTLALSPSLSPGPAARRREFPSASASAKGALPQGTPKTWTSVARPRYLARRYCRVSLPKGIDVAVPRPLFILVLNG